jgi:hypothetical protein
LKPTKGSNSNISVDNKFSTDYLINKLIDVEKRLTFKEYKQSNHKKKINLIMDDLYERNLEPKDVEEEFESKFKEVVDEPEVSTLSVESAPLSKISSMFQLPPQIRMF